MTHLASPAASPITPASTLSVGGVHTPISVLLSRTGTAVGPTRTPVLAKAVAMPPAALASSPLRAASALGLPLATELMAPAARRSHHKRRTPSDAELFEQRRMRKVQEEGQQQQEEGHRAKRQQHPAPVAEDHEHHDFGSMDVLSALVAAASSSALQSTSMGSSSSSLKSLVQGRLQKRHRHGTSTDDTETTASILSPSSSSSAASSGGMGSTSQGHHRRRVINAFHRTPEPQAEGEDDQEYEPGSAAQSLSQHGRRSSKRSRRQVVRSTDLDPEDAVNEDEAEAEAADQDFTAGAAAGGGSGGVGRQADEEEAEDSESSSVRKPGQRTTRLCLPCPTIKGLPLHPLQTLYLQVQKQYTVSVKQMESGHYTEAERESLVAVPVRILGSTDDLSRLYFVAKDVCLLAFIRKGNVAKSISQFAEHEKARIPIMCPRANGTSSLHLLTALSIEGVKRLMTSSRLNVAEDVLAFLMAHVDALIKNGVPPPPIAPAAAAAQGKTLAAEADQSDSEAEAEPEDRSEGASDTEAATSAAAGGAAGGEGDSTTGASASASASAAAGTEGEAAGPGSPVISPPTSSIGRRLPAGGAGRAGGGGRRGSKRSKSSRRPAAAAAAAAASNSASHAGPPPVILASITPSAFKILHAAPRK